MHSYNGEYTKSYIKILCSCVVCKLAVYAVYYIFGNLFAVAAATAVVIIFFNYLNVKNNGSRRLKHCLGCVNHAVNKVCALAEGAGGYVGCKHTYASLSAIENEILVINGNTVKFSGSSTGDARLKCNSEIVSYTYRIIASVKGNLTYGYARLDYFSFLCSYIVCSFYGVLTAFCKMYLQILKALLNFHRIKYFVCADTGSALHASVPAAACSSKYRAVSVSLISH